MKKFLMFFVLCTFAFVACEKTSTKDGDNATPKIKLTSDGAMEFGYEGGTDYITYLLSNPINKEGLRVAAATNVNWIEIINDGTQFEIVVAPNELSERKATITLSYPQAKNVAVEVRQAGNPAAGNVEFKAKRFEGNYWGKSNVNTYNYYVVISDIGASRSLEPKAGGRYYFFDFYSSEVGDEANPVLPNGTYTFDATDSYKAGTFTDEASWYALMDEDGGYAESKSFKEATVVVSDNKFEATITFSNGNVHKITYEGSLATTLDLSTLPADYNFTIEGATVTATNYGDSYNMGSNAWFIEVVKDTQSGDMFQLEVLSDNADNCFGLYTEYDGSSDAANKFLPGLLADNGLACSWYAKFEGGRITGDVIAPLLDGVIKIDDAGAGNVTISIACTDDAYNNIEGTISGSLQLK